MLCIQRQVFRGVRLVTVSMLCRFNGHCRHFYSVAEHSVLVSQMVPSACALQALMHDAPEAYFSDIPRPIKRRCPEIEQLERRLWQAVAKKFAIDEHMASSVRDADEKMLERELSLLLYGNAQKPPRDHLQCLPPPQAKRLFLERFKEISS